MRPPWSLVLAGLLVGLGAGGEPPADAPAPAVSPAPDAPAPAPLRPPELRGEVPDDARIADYRIDARLDAERHEVAGTAELTWRNRTARAVGALPFHLYMNAFRAEDTAWMRESRGTHRQSRQRGDDDGAWGYIDLRAVRLLPGPGGPLAADQGETLTWREGPDPTVMTVDLPRPVGPGEAVTLRLDFLTKLPRVFARTGYAGDFHMVGQWYPKIGVLDPERGWLCHVFTLNSEFYADFGDYEVTLDVPERFVVGATGVREGESVEAGRRHLRYRAEMVHDFAWAADPTFVERAAEWRGVAVRQLLQPDFAADADAHFEAAFATLESMERRYGPYPWSTLTIVHAPEDADGASGMEYPTLFTTSDILPRDLWWRVFDLDERVSGLLTTVHELGHQYFQGLLASDEFSEPWLDEGINTFSNSMVFADWRGEAAWMLRLGPQAVSDPELVRLSLLRGVDLDPVASPADAFLEVNGGYGATVYRKTAAIMFTLRNLAGAAAFDDALRAYALRWRFRHPRGQDLVDALLEGLGPTLTLSSGGPGSAVTLDVAEFLDQALHTVEPLDFALARVDNRRRLGDAGYRRDEHGALVGGGPRERADVPLRDLPDDAVEGVVVVRRQGGLRVPVELEVETEGGARERLLWDGQGRYHVFTFPGRRLRRAELDPDHKLTLEARRLDNLRYAAGEPAPPGLSAPVARSAEAVALAILGGISL